MIFESVGINKNYLNLILCLGCYVIKYCLYELGYKEFDYDLEVIYVVFLKLVDKKGQVYDYDLEVLLFFDQQKYDQVYYQLMYLYVILGKEIILSVIVQLKIGDDIVICSEIGNGLVDVFYKVIMVMLGYNDLEVVDFKLDLKGEGVDVLVLVSVIIEYKGCCFYGIGLVIDIVEVGVKVFIFVLNNMYLVDQIDQ